MLSVLSWNIQGLSYKGTYTAFKKILPVLLRSSADIICLQEMCEAEIKLLNQFKDFHIYIPEFNSSKQVTVSHFNHNVIVSRLPFSKVGELSFPSSLKKDIILEAVSKMEFIVSNKVLRIYNCHFAIDGVGWQTRLKQIEYIINDCSNFTGPVVICGDFNTVVPKPGWRRKLIQFVHQIPNDDLLINNELMSEDERFLFNEAVTKAGFTEAFDLHKPTWSLLKTKHWEVLKLKPDWFLTKNLSVLSRTLGDYISDHRSMLVELE